MFRGDQKLQFTESSFISYKMVLTNPCPLKCKTAATLVACKSSQAGFLGSLGACITRLARITCHWGDREAVCFSANVLSIYIHRLKLYLDKNAWLNLKTTEF